MIKKRFGAFCPNIEAYRRKIDAFSGN